MLDSKIPKGPLPDKWMAHKDNLKLVAPANRRKLKIIVVGSGLGGAAAAASLGELGYQVEVFCLNDSPRRAHSVAAQGGINAAKNYSNDNDSVYRLFCDTLKGGDYRSREANVYRLAELSNLVIDQCVAQGVPFARDYGGLLHNRSFGGALVSRTFYARSQTGQQLLIGAYSALNRQVSKGNVCIYPRREMLDLILVDGEAKGILARNLVTGCLERYSAHAVVIATGGYSNVYYRSTNAMSSNGSAIWQCYKKGAFFANPCFAQIHPTCIPTHGDFSSKVTLMSESLRNDGRVWVPKNREDAERVRKNLLNPRQIPLEKRDYFLERRYPAFGNLVPRDVASRASKERCDCGFDVTEYNKAVFLDFDEAVGRLGSAEMENRYGNLFQMYQKITSSDPLWEPMKICPAPHYTMGGLWVDYNLMTTIHGLYAIGEANFSDHGANRLGASALMQGLVDGYFVLPGTIGDWLSNKINEPVMDVTHDAFKNAEFAVQSKINKLLSEKKGSLPVRYFHKELGKVMWEHVGMVREEPGLQHAMDAIHALKNRFWEEVLVPGNANQLNCELEKALRVADFFEIGELMALDALSRKESCGCNFRTEMQTPDGDTLRDDKNCMHVSAWAYSGLDSPPVLHKEPLTYEYCTVGVRNYKD